MEAKENNLKTVAEIYEEGLKNLSIVVYHINQATGQDIRALVKNVVAKDILKMIRTNESQMKVAYDNFRSEVSEPNVDSQPVQ